MRFQQRVDQFLLGGFVNDQLASMRLEGPLALLSGRCFDLGKERFDLRLILQDLLDEICIAIWGALGLPCERREDVMTADMYPNARRTNAEKISDAPRTRNFLPSCRKEFVQPDWATPLGGIHSSIAQCVIARERRTTGGAGRGTTWLWAGSR